MTSYIDSINSIAITADEMIRAQTAVSDEGTTERSFEATVFKLSRAFPKQHKKITAIVFRMQALSRLIESSRPGWWFLPQADDGSYAVSELALRVAATCRLFEAGNEVVFDQTEFLEQALRLSETDSGS